MPPVSRKQQKFIYARAGAGAEWAKKFIHDAPSMEVKKPAKKKNGGSKKK